MAHTAANLALNGIQSPPLDLSKPIDTSAIRGLTILITGGASGLGAAFARHWAAHGANIIIGDLNHRQGERVIADLRTTSSHPHHHFLPLDVTSWPSQLNFFEEAVKLSPTGGIDCVVANAGISLSEESAAFENPPDYRGLLGQGKYSTQSPPPAPTLQILDVNLTGVLYTTHLAHAYLPHNPGSSRCEPNPQPTDPDPKRENRDRHILLVCSIAGLQPLPTQSLYAVSKHGVTGLFRNLRITSPLRQGIRVNMLCPFFTATPILGGVAANALLAGAAMSEMASVVEAATRLVADRGIVGRGLVVAPRASKDDAEAVGLHSQGQDPGHEQAVWEAYAHDFEQSDLLSRRLVALTSLLADRKGWIRFLRDLGWALVGEPLTRSWRGRR